MECPVFRLFICACLRSYWANLTMWESQCRRALSPLKSTDHLLMLPFTYHPPRTQRVAQIQTNLPCCIMKFDYCDHEDHHDPLDLLALRPVKDPETPDVPSWGLLSVTSQRSNSEIQILLINPPANKSADKRQSTVRENGEQLGKQKQWTRHKGKPLEEIKGLSLLVIIKEKGLRRSGFYEIERCQLWDPQKKIESE